MHNVTGVETKASVAIVTGGASGIGRATARRLSAEGYHVVAADFRPPPGSAAEFRAAGIELRPCDVRCEADVRATVAVAAQAGPIRVLVNNAGIALVKQIPDVTEEEWDACLDTNLKGPFLLSKHVIPHLRAAGGGSIVNVASNAGLLPRAHDPVYSTSKGALIAFTKSLALSHAPDRIRVNAVCPGPVGQTRMMNDELDASSDPAGLAMRIIAASPLARAYGRMIDPDEVAAAIAYLVSDAARFVTGTSLAIDGGKALGVPPPA